MMYSSEIETNSGVNRTKDGELSTPTEDVDMNVNLHIQEEAIPPDGGWGWFVMIGCLLSHIIIGLPERSIGVFYLQIKSHYDQSAEMSSWAVSVSFMLTLLLAPFASALCNRFKIRTVVALGATLSSVGVLIAAFSSDIYCFSFGFGLLLGCGLAFAHGPSLIILGQYFNKRRSLAAAIATSGAPLSSLLFSTTLDALFKYYGFSGAFIILTAILCNFYICAALYRPLELNQRFIQQDRRKELKTETSRILSIRTGYIDEETTHPSGITNSYKCERSQVSLSKTDCLTSGCKETAERISFLEFSLLKDFAFLSLYVQLFLFPLSFNTMLTYLPALVLERTAGTIEGTYLLSCIGVCDALTRLVVSIFLDMERIRPHRLVIYNVTIFSIALTTGVVPLISAFWQFYVVSCVYGVSLGLYLAQKSVVCVDVLGVEHLTSALGLLLAFQGIGIIVSPIVGGLLKDNLGSYDVVFYVGSVGTFVGGTVMAAGNVWFYRRRSKGYDVVK